MSAIPPSSLQGTASNPTTTGEVWYFTRRQGKKFIRAYRRSSTTRWFSWGARSGSSSPIQRLRRKAYTNTFARTTFRRCPLQIYSFTKLRTERLFRVAYLPGCQEIYFEALPWFGLNVNYDEWQSKYLTWYDFVFRVNGSRWRSGAIHLGFLWCTMIYIWFFSLKPPAAASRSASCCWGSAPSASPCAAAARTRIVGRAWCSAPTRPVDASLQQQAKFRGSSRKQYRQPSSMGDISGTTGSRAPSRQGVHVREERWRGTPDWNLRFLYYQQNLKFQ